LAMIAADGKVHTFFFQFKCVYLFENIQQTLQKQLSGLKIYKERERVVKFD